MSLLPFSRPGIGPGQHAMLLISIDNLTLLERLFGAEMISDVMRECYCRLRAVSPKISSLWQSHPSRFAITIPGMTEAGARDLATAIQAKLAREPIETAFGETSVTASVGCAVAGNNSLEQLGSAAQDALVDALNAGNGAIRIASSDKEIQAQRARAVSSAQAALTALGAGHLSVAFQPVISSHNSQNIPFYQCLGRFHQDGGSTASLDAYRPRINRLGLSSLLDRQILVLALDALRNAPTARLSVALSESTFQDQEWIAILRNAIRGGEDLAERMIIEIREPYLHAETLPKQKFIKTMREAGACLSLTAFGARQTRIRELAELRFDMVKLDPRLTNDLSTNPENQLLVDSLIAKASHLDLMVVSEGVRTAEDAQILTKLGVGYMQGDLFGEESSLAAPQHQVDQWIRKTA
ncbi:MAG: GGDEF domain-containing protein [Pseudomonadota bacterium]